MVTAALNPLRAGARLARTPEPAALVIFGGAGDLAGRKLIPALYNLELQRLLPAAFAVVATARRPVQDEAYRQELHDAVAEFSRTKPINEEVWRSFSERVRYIATPDDEGYETLARTLKRIDDD
ncbi:MAG: glucose-6-phosphate dehydrogenase, partial [Candidatus Limnocylindria bacterium]